MSKANEFQLIKRYFAPLIGDDEAGISAFKLQDDAAFFTLPKGKQLVVTQDALASNIHFFDNDPPKLIAKKALRTNLSDLAAKGAAPFSYSLALGLPKNFDEAFVKEFAQGLQEDQDEYGIKLSGGDSFTSSGGLTLSISAFGLVDEGNYVSRLGANEGDMICTTGTIGDAALGLQCRLGDLKGLSSDDETYLIERYLLPQPRITLIGLISRFASASMDISDGLVGDLMKLLEASNLGGIIEKEKIPLSKAAQRLPDHFETAITGGDDYELLFTINPQDFEQVQKLARGAGVLLSPIGKTIEFDSTLNKRLDIIDETGKVLHLQNTAYQHF